MITLIDADIVAYRCAATANGLPEDIAHLRVDELMRRILDETGSKEYIAFLSGSNNFRYDIYPEYKANRANRPRPEWWESCKEFLVKEWNAKVTDGIEADDALGIYQSTHSNSCIASIDKDLLQIPGRHFNFVKGIWTDITELDGRRNFYSQLITGDGSDNIPAFDGKLRNSIPKFVQRILDPLQEMEKEWDMYKYVKYSVYPFLNEGEDNILYRNAQLLYIHKKEGDFWRPPGLREG